MIGVIIGKPTLSWIEKNVCVFAWYDTQTSFEEKGYLLPTLARKITLPTFRLNAPD